MRLQAVRVALVRHTERGSFRSSRARRRRDAAVPAAETAAVQRSAAFPACRSAGFQPARGESWTAGVPPAGSAPSRRTGAVAGSETLANRLKTGAFPYSSRVLGETDVQFWILCVRSRRITPARGTVLRTTPCGEACSGLRTTALFARYPSRLDFRRQNGERPPDSPSDVQLQRSEAVA
jgi:hypothetical protein